jgi:hypothetical protein
MPETPPLADRYSGPPRVKGSRPLALPTLPMKPFPTGPADAFSCLSPCPPSQVFTLNKQMQAYQGGPLATTTADPAEDSQG